MSTWRVVPPWNRSAGFSLVEMLVALAIVSIIIASMTAVFERSGRLYTTQNAAAALQQEVRAAMDVIVSETRMAAYDPAKSGEFEIKKAEATQFRFEADYDGNEKVGGYKADGTVAKNEPYSESPESRCENRTFRYNLTGKSIHSICGTDAETLIGGADSNIKVTALDFSYRDKKNNPTSLVSEIRGAVITITAQAPAGREGMIERTYRTSVDFRNTGLNNM